MSPAEAAGQAPPVALRSRPQNLLPGSTELRSIFGKFATGITVLTVGTDPPCGMTANSFSSVSLDPPLALVCVKRDASVHRAILSAEAFAVSVLSAAQEPVARYFADRSRPRGEREFDAVVSTPGRFTGAPLIENALAWVECGLDAVYEGGDHSILVGSVLGASVGGPTEALLFYAGGYHRLVPR